MMGRRSYNVLTSTAQMQVIGRRHFGLKALPAGGGGGKMITRELFDTLLFWRGRVALDDKGEATVETRSTIRCRAFASLRWPPAAPTCSAAAPLVSARCKS